MSDNPLGTGCQRLRAEASLYMVFTLALGRETSNIVQI